MLYLNLFKEVKSIPHSMMMRSKLLLANKNRVVCVFFRRFCQVFTPSMKQVNCSGWRIECRICTDNCI